MTAGHAQGHLARLADHFETLGRGLGQRLQLGQVRIPDVAFYGWDKFPDHLLPLEKILSAVPDLSVEVLSEGNTDEEMERKRREFFGRGTKIIPAAASICSSRTTAAIAVRAPLAARRNLGYS